MTDANEILQLLEEYQKRHRHEDADRKWMRRLNVLRDVCRKWAINNLWPQKIFVNFEDLECEVCIYVYAPAKHIKTSERQHTAMLGVALSQGIGLNCSAQCVSGKVDAIMIFDKEINQDAEANRDGEFEKAGNLIADEIWEPMKHQPRCEGLYAARHALWRGHYGIVRVKRTCHVPEKFRAYDEIGREYELEELTDWCGVPTCCPECGQIDLDPADGSYWCACCGREHDEAEYTPGPLPLPQQDDQNLE